MRTLMILVLTAVVVTGLRRKERLLVEIIDNVELLLKPSSKLNLHQFVKDVIPSARCTEENFCQAARVIMNTNRNLTMLHRRLSAYANYSKHHSCSVSASEEYTMEVFLKNIKDCSKEQYKLMRKKHVK